MNTTVQSLPAVTPVRPVTPHRPALRLINTKTLSRDAWPYPLQANERASWRRTIHRKAMAPKFMVRA